MMRIYHGWVVVGFAMFSSMLVLGILQSSFSLFVIPVSEDLGLSRANMNSVLVLTSAGNAVVAPFVGYLVDRYSNRLILGLCSIVLAMGFVILGLTSSMALSIVCILVLLPIGCDGTVSITFNKMVARWFNRLRARAMAISAIGMSIGAAIMPPVVAVLLETVQWRMTLVILGLAMGLFILVFSIVMREAPDPGEEEPASAAQTTVVPANPANEERHKLGFYFTSAPFWTIMLAASLLFGVTSGTMVSLVPIAIDQNYSMLQATALITALSVSGIASKLALAWAGDRFERPMLMAANCLLAIIMCLIFMFDNSYPAMVACALILGVVWGSMVPLSFTSLIDIFGTQNFGVTRGLFSPYNAVFVAFAVRFAGEVYDRTDAYDIMYQVFLAFSVLAFCGMLLLRRLTRPVSVNTGTSASLPR